MHYRSLTYAYPTSPGAKRFGKAISGCYVVSVLREDGSPVHEEPHDDKYSALRHYDAMPSLEIHEFSCIRHRFPAADATPVIDSIRRQCCYGSCSLFATYSNGKEGLLFSYYLDELAFSDAELFGLTEDEAHNLRRDKDIAYLRS